VQPIPPEVPHSVSGQGPASVTLELLGRPRVTG
jgi:hypothetical protein